MENLGGEVVWPTGDPNSESAHAVGIVEPDGLHIDLAERNGSPPSVVEAPTDGAHVARLEAEIADWQRRAVMWRERALSSQALNDALNSHLADLQAVLALQAGGPAAPSDGPVATVAREPIEQWWMRVFRRDTWTSPR